MALCQNCNTEITGKFCSECGQKATVKRITGRSVFSDLIKKITMWDKGLMYTSLHLLTKPGKMARSFIAGHRVNYTKPLNYLLIIVGLSLLVFSKEDMQQAMSSMSGNKQSNAYVEWVFSNISIIYLTMIPFLALVSRWFNRKSDVNYAEHFVFYCYLMAGSTLISTPFTAIGNYFHMDVISLSPFGMVQYSCWFLYFAWGYVQFFRKQNRWWGGIQAIAVLLIAYLLYILTFGILFTIVAIVGKILFDVELIPMPTH
jgi:Protein of unknown function (DUF3667)